MLSKLNIAKDTFTFSVNGQTIPASSTWDLVLDLGDAYTVVIITFWAQDISHVSSVAKRKSIMIVATTDINDCYSQANTRQVIGFTAWGNNYSNTGWKYLGFSYATDSKLSDGDYDVGGANIQVNSAYIDGTKLKIRFENLRLVSNTLRIEGKIRAERAKLL